MPNIGNILNQNAIIFKLNAHSRNEVIKKMAKIADSVYGLDEFTVFENALAREALGGTGLAEGVALPHARIKNINQVYGVFAVLEKPIDFDAPDSKPSDLIFMIISPENAGAEHLKALAKVSRFLNDDDARAALRAARSLDAVYALITDVSSIAI